MKSENIQIISNGKACGNKVLIDGKELKGMASVKFKIDVDNLSKTKLTPERVSTKHQYQNM